ncbi:hypothetical protein NC652_016536 [Populus alba x Populus x berolinensis]|nr:hypothetical protein NC651_016030 [Populus alba x Populus x berolinensis]KAJ6922914.1 hypothetical protein NC652_016536 [Populus alba x Populus x berolinensis]
MNMISLVTPNSVFLAMRAFSLMLCAALALHWIESPVFLFKN